ncbi:DUF1938 domain-containing protein [Thermococcus sp. GR7]|uniref:methylated-DNA--protein-cysteine methyltransferase n=1 Tax=unclassified Thermococcus TaxID=2627626 RepID=UPI001431264C|nr:MULTISPECIES: methylated-DNA--protein-cysteine methyltransferase [unclassified Thermococcus]NJE46706.1 DUF1938 domain-containing protein [Thermococcus sp. GR7]NJE77866.1 DUF1938 domain-containing protein [Thermococcus sp. GR4]NJF22994.1 DUF1938 domain-containing protein [Thermococcus sp. GR5]
MLSVERFDIARKEVWIAVIFDEKIQGITFSLDEEGFLRERIANMAFFLKKRGVNVELTLLESDYPRLVRDVILGKLENEELLPELGFLGVTSFERRVYEWLTKRVKRGSVVTYGELAKTLGTSPRAIGGAMKRNPYPIVVPCHRVVAWDGPGYYTPKLEYKAFLLKLEGVEEWTSSKRT